ncbi:MAG: alginate export family protein [Leptospira sp.]|nr:alginate export family protein [Leptospira sp.]
MKSDLIKITGGAFCACLLTSGLLSQGTGKGGSVNLDPPADIKYEAQPNDGKGIPEIQEELAKEVPYVSPYKGKLPGELMKSQLLAPDHQDAVRKVERLWFGDIFRIGFQARPRWDYSHNSDFDKRTLDDRNYGSQNSQVWFAVDPSKYAAAKVTIQDVREFGGSQTAKGGQLGYLGQSNNIGIDLSAAPTTTTQQPIKNNTDLREGFVILKNIVDGFEFIVGRQILGFGHNRYVGGRNDGQIGNSFDGARLKYTSKYFTSEVFSTVLAADTNGSSGITTANGQRKGGVNNTALSGLYNSLKFEDFSFDFFIFNVDRKWEQSLTVTPATTQDKTRQRDDLNTAGFLLSNRTNSGNTLPKNKSWDWTLEASWQFGNNGTRVNAGWDIFNQSYGGQRLYTEKVQYDTHFVLAQTGYTFFDRFRVGLQYSVGSGDPNRSDNKVATYDASFATRSGGFPYFDSGNGIVNATFWSNTKTKSVHLMYNTEKLGKFIFVAYDIQKASQNDAWYNSAGAQNVGLSTENANNQKYGGFGLGYKPGQRLFYEYDLIWQYYLKDYISIWSGASLLVAGDAIANQRVNPLATDATARYSLDNKSYSFFFFVQFAM